MSQTEERTTSSREEDETASSQTEDKRKPRSPVNDAIRIASEYVTQLTGRTPDAVSGVSRSDEGWTVTVEVVELNRIPSSTDLIASYEVLIDDDGELVDFRRGRRFMRSQASQE